MRGFQAHSFMNSFLEANGCCNIVCGRHLTVSTVDFPLTKSSHWYCSNRPCRFFRDNYGSFHQLMGFGHAAAKKKTSHLEDHTSGEFITLVFGSRKNCCHPIYLGKLSYFTNLNSSAIWGWFLLLTTIIVRSQWGRYNLPRSITGL